MLGVGSAFTSRAGMLLGTSIVMYAGCTQVGIMARSDLWGCGCSKKTFGRWREHHSQRCNVKRGIRKHILIRVDRRLEWSRTRDPERLRRSHYHKNKRRWDAIQNPDSRYFGDWTYWTDRTE